MMVVKKACEPLVSCIMPTCDRRRFIPQALRYFANRSYRNAELIVIDDGVRSVRSLCEGVEGVRYFRVSPATTGAKLNLGIEAARGEILQKIDDDDYYGPEFLQSSVEHLIGKDPKRTLVTRCCFLTLIRSDGILRYSKHGWKAGGGLCFHRELWRTIPFRDLYRGSDSWFLRDHNPELELICAPEQYVLVRHGRNSWTSMRTEGSDQVIEADDHLRGMPAYEKTASEFFESEDLGFYRRVLRWK